MISARGAETVFLRYAVMKKIHGMLEQRCTNGTNMLNYILSQSGGTNDINQLLDDLKSRMGCEFTVFEGNTRAYTTVVKKDRPDGVLRL